MATKDYSKMADSILSQVGGSANVSTVTHCMTRLRFTLKDMSAADDNKVKQIPGVLGVVRAGGQYQIVIGQTVPEVYDAVVKAGNLTTTAPIDENLDAKSKEKLTVKSALNLALNKVAGSLTPLIPMLMAASIFKMLAAICGPSMLNWISANSDTYKLFTFVGDAGFYFFPVIIGYTFAKQIGANKIMAMFLGAIMIDPNLINIVTAGKAFHVYGLPMTLTNYSSTIVPIMLSVWCMKYVEKLFDKYIPASLRTIFAPTLTIAVMLPIALCVLGPLGGFIGSGICNGILAFGKVGGVWAILGVAIIGALWEILVLTGMHLVMISVMTVLFSQGGHDNFVTLGGVAASIAVSGMCLGAALRLKNKEERSLAFGYIIAGLIGGVTEPGLYGIAIRYRKPFIGLMAGGFAGGLYAAITHVTAYVMVPVANFLALSAYVGGSTANIVNGIISGVIAFVVAAIVSYIVGVNDSKQTVAA